MVIQINEKNFKKEVLEENLPVVVDFYADWCPPCQILHPLLEEISEKYREKIKFTRVNIGESEKIAQDYNINSIPTLVFFKNGKEIKRIVGLVGKEEIENNLETF